MDGSRVRPYAEVRRGAGAGTPSSCQCVHDGLGAFGPPPGDSSRVRRSQAWSPTDCNRLHVFCWRMPSIHHTPRTHVHCSPRAHYLSLAAPLRAGAARRGLREHRCGDTCPPTCSDRLAVDSRAPPRRRRPSARKPARPPPDARRAEAPNEPQGRASAQMGLVLT